MNKVRVLNGYRVIFLPEHHRAMASDNWRDWVYEHIVVAEESLGRKMRDDEVVHHLDEDRANNRRENLLVLERGQHAKLHTWLESGAVGVKTSIVNGVNSGKSTATKPEYCKVCARTLQERQKAYCSNSCRGIAKRKVDRPDKEELAEDMRCMSMLAIGRKYGVSDNAVRKWARRYSLL